MPPTPRKSSRPSRRPRKSVSFDKAEPESDWETASSEAKSETGSETAHSSDNSTVVSGKHASSTEFRLKIYMQDEDSPLTTLEFDSPTPAEFGKTTFAAVRKRIGDAVDEAYQFCDEDGGIFEDAQTLRVYFKEQDQDIIPDKSLSVHLKTKSGNPLSYARILKNPPFLLKFVQQLKDNDSQMEGSLHSSKLQGAAAGRLGLGDLRKLVKSMSSDPKIHKFCLDDGHVVDDNITLEDYVSMLSTDPPESRSNSTPMIEIYFTKKDTFKRSTSKWHESRLDTPAPKATDHFEYQDRLDATRDVQAAQDAKLTDSDVAQGSSSGGKTVSAGTLSEQEWAIVLRNCNVMYGWTVDIKNNRLCRAPMPAFRLRPGLNLLSGSEQEIILKREAKQRKQVEAKPKKQQPKPRTKSTEEELDALERELLPTPELVLPTGTGTRRRLERPGAISRPSFIKKEEKEESTSTVAASASTSTSSQGPEVAAPTPALATPKSTPGPVGDKEANEGESASGSDSEEDSEDDSASGTDGKEGESDGGSGSEREDSEESGSGSGSAESSDVSGESDAEEEEEEEEEEESATDDEKIKLRRQRADLKRQNRVLKKTLHTLKDILEGKSVASSDEEDEEEGDDDDEDDSEEDSSDGNESGGEVKAPADGATDGVSAQDSDESDDEEDSDDDEESESDDDSEESASQGSEDEASDSDDGTASDAGKAVATSTSVAKAEPSAVVRIADSKAVGEAASDTDLAYGESDDGEDIESDGQEVKEDEPETDRDASESDEDSDEDATIPIPNKALAIPNFTVDDRSKVEVVSASNEFEMSMATNHFSVISAEASASGGYAGWSAEVNVSAASDTSSQDKKGQASKESTMIATYKFPRATVYLTSKDLVPTEELEAALKLVSDSRDINDLRKLHANFGHLFCQQVLIGGALQSTKIMSSSSTSVESNQKESFRASVGVAVQSPVGVGASAKASTENGTGTDKGQSSQKLNESMVFEATGGDTLLASNPPEWINSVMASENWRVIEQGGLTAIAHVLSEIRGYEEVPQWIMRAIPILANYITIPRQRTLDFRFKVMLEEESISRIAAKRVQSYLSHKPGNLVWPVRNGLEQLEVIEWDQITHRRGDGWEAMDVTRIARQKDSKEFQGLFLPARTQAPVLSLYDSIRTSAGDQASPLAEVDLKETSWRLLVPDGKVLAHNSRISIQSLAEDHRPMMTVYRNQQGVFLPAMTDNEGPAFWRILKTTPNATEGQTIQDGEVVRFCWNFKDQTSGFRDFYDDAFGRRRFVKPEGVQESLYLKVPFPRFEMSDSSGMALVMSAANTSLPVVEWLDVLPTSVDGPVRAVSMKYNLFDLSFRLDSAAQAESKDYMIAGVDQTNKEIVTTERIVELGTRTETHQVLPPPVEFIAKSVLGVIGGPLFGGLLSSFLF